jgi:hypothetical protein
MITSTLLGKEKNQNGQGYKKGDQETHKKEQEPKALVWA